MSVPNCWVIALCKDINEIIVFLQECEICLFDPMNPIEEMAKPFLTVAEMYAQLSSFWPAYSFVFVVRI